MRIAWATPLNARSAIGRAGLGVAEELARRGHSLFLIDLEAQEHRTEPRHNTHLPSAPYSEIDLGALRTSFDAVVAEIGDHALLHAGLFPLLEQTRPLGIFHDFYLYDLFAGWLAARRLPPEVHDGEVAATYGAEFLEAARAARAGELELRDMAARLPMTEWVARRCAAALAHSPFYLPRLRASCPGPSRSASLPWRPRRVPPLPRRSGGRVVAVTVGFMNPNKCADRVIQAIADSPWLLERLEYRLVGSISDAERERLTRLAQDGGVRLEILGSLDDAGLEAQLAAADIICCLRDPVLEGASASAIEGLLTGRPVMVANDGFYADIPDEYAVKVPPRAPPAEVRRALEALVADEPRRRQLGAAAARWARDTFTTRRYADALEALLAEMIEAMPLLRTGGAFADELNRLGLRRDDPAVDRILETLAPVLEGGATTGSPALNN